jgi:hypothetical protein
MEPTVKTFAEAMEALTMAFVARELPSRSVRRSS